MSTVVKIQLDGDIRRLHADTVRTFGSLQQAIYASYPHLCNKSVAVSYIDDEGDQVTIANDAELAEAFRIAGDENRKSLRLNITRAANSTVPTTVLVGAARGAAAAAPAQPSAAFQNRHTTSAPEAKHQNPSPKRKAKGKGKGKGKGKSKGKKVAERVVQPAPDHAAGMPGIAQVMEAQYKAVLDTLDSSLAPVLSASAVQADALATAALNAAGLAAEVTDETKSVSAPPAPAAPMNPSFAPPSAPAPVRECKQQQDETPKPAKPVPLRVTSGGAKVFLDGTVEHAAGGGDAHVGADGSVTCTVLPGGFPSITAEHLALASGKWYFETTLLTEGCMQVGWATPDFTGDAFTGDGVGDDASSWAYDGYRRLRWHGAASESWGPKWKRGSVVCCALDADTGTMSFALNGQWPDDPTMATAFHHASNGGVSFVPAVSLSQGQRLRFNFGAPGTPLSFGPPDTTYKPVWEAYGTASNVAKSQNARPMFFNTVRLNGAGLDAEVKCRDPTPQQHDRRHRSDQPPQFRQSPAVRELCRLLALDETRAAISQALSHEAVAGFVQHALSASFDGAQALRQTVREHMPNLVPVLMELAASQPQLLAVVPAFLSCLAELGVLPRKICRGWKRRMGRCGGGGGCRGNSHRRRSDKPNWRKKWGGCPASQGPAGAGWLGAMAQTFMTAASNAAANVTSATEAAGTNAATMIDQALQASLQEASDSEEEALKKAVDMSIQDAIEKAKQASSSTATRSAHAAVPSDLAETKAAAPRARFIQASGTQQPVYPGAAFQHAFRVLNSGESAWPANCHVSCTGGTPEPNSYADVKIHVGAVQPGQQVDIILPLRAPSSAGRHVTYWRLCGDGGLRFGDRFWVDVTVQDIPQLHPVPSYDEAIGNAGADSAAVESKSGPAVATTEDLPPTPAAGVSVDTLTDWVAVSKDMHASTTSSAGSNSESLPEPVPQEQEQEQAHEQEHEVRDPKHAMLIAMGFDADAALAALAATNGDAATAIAHLTTSQ